MGDCITILVTGATGRIGKHLVKALLDKGEKVRVLIRKTMTEFENVETFYGDLLDRKSLKKAVEDIDTVFHLAAVVDYTAPEDLMFRINVIGTRNILDVFKGDKFIYLSSTAVLGKKLKDLPADENTDYNPSNLYGRTKMEAEKLVKENKGIIIRSPDVLMPRFVEGYDFIFSKLLEGEMSIIGDGKNFIDYIHISDLIQALLLAKDKGRRGEIYLVSGKGVKTQKQCLELACKYLNVEAPKKHKTALSAKVFSRGSVIKSKIKGKTPEFIPEYVEKMLRNRTFDITKAKNELSFEPKIDLETSIKEMVEDYLERLEEEQEEISEEQSE
ncbi:MAG: NAD-dependent epimerase/dehydratase family protein [Candidatus Aenigmarchaeota archaeon]|nr:NAD-dependent epimerase/dehydratase family protein [Candidatus Aenigmarchaeota archaeon]